MIIKNISWLLMDKVLRLFLGLITSVIVARTYGAADFGLFVLAQGVISILSAISNIGIPNVLFKDITSVGSKIKKIRIHYAIQVQLVGCSIAFILALLYLVAINADFPLFIIMLTLLVANMFQPFALYENDFIANNKVEKLIPFYIFTYILFFAFKLFVVYVGFDIETFSLVYGLEICVLYVLPMFLFHKLNTYNERVPARKVKTLIQCFTNSYIKRLLRLSIPIAVSGLIYSIYMRVDLVVIECFGTHSLLGLYGTAVKFCDPMIVFATTITTAVYPSIVNKFKTDSYMGFICHIKNLTKWMLLGSILIACGLSYFSIPLITKIFGTQFYDGAHILRVYSFSIVFFFWGAIFGRVLITLQLQKYIVLPLAIGLITKLALTAIIIIFYDYNSIGYSTLIASMIANFGGFLLLRETRKVIFDIIGLNHRLKNC